MPCGRWGHAVQGRQGGPINDSDLAYLSSLCKLCDLMATQRRDFAIVHTARSTFWGTPQCSDLVTKHITFSFEVDLCCFRAPDDHQIPPWRSRVRVLTTVSMLCALARRCPGASLLHRHDHEFARSAAGSNVAMPPALAAAWADLLALHLRPPGAPGADGRRRSTRCRSGSVSA